MRGAIARRATTIAVASLCVAGGLAAVAPGVASATPVRNDTAWSVLLCKFSDQPAEPQSPQFFTNFFTPAGSGMGGLADYYADQSYGKVSLAGSVVEGWYTEPYTLADEQGVDRWTRIQHCVQTAASAGYSVPAGNRVAVMINTVLDSGAAGGEVLLDPNDWNVRFAAHEMGHGYGLDHSYSNDLSYQNASWSAPGEYDDEWDEMSAQHSFAFQTPYFGASAVGFNGPNRDELGWLPIHRVITMGADGVGTRTFTLAPLEVPSADGPLLIRIPFNPGDLFNYYTVEYRRQTGWSAAIPGDTVLIHEVRGGTPYLQRLLDGSRAPAQSLNANGVQITVNSVSGNAATVTISTDIVDRCVEGYVWREASPTDHVCVTGAVRDQVAADNAAASSRWVDGPYGAHTCISGYVWREAFAGDDVCVTVDQRSQAVADNAAAADRGNPARLVYGPNACQSGYVWREADDTDYVCVAGAVRDQVAADNAAASSRWADGPYGAHTCISGYVWREAFTGDDVCVTVDQRSQAAADNAAASGRVLRPAG